MRKSLLTVAAVAAAVLSVAPAVSAAKAPSTFLAGYQTTQVGISRATASVVAPTVTCPASGTAGVTFGIGNEPSAGHLSLLAGVRVVCSGGVLQIFGYAFAGTEHALQLGQVEPGDRFNLRISQTTRSITAMAKDVTTGGTFRASGTPVPDNTLTFGAFPLESGVTPLPVPDFGTVTVSDPVLENTGLRAWGPTRLNRTDGTTTQIATGAFLHGDFPLTFAHS